MGMIAKIHFGGPSIIVRARIPRDRRVVEDGRPARHARPMPDERGRSPYINSETLGRSQINGVGFFSYADISTAHFPATRVRVIAVGLDLCLFSQHTASASNFTLEQVMSSPFPSNLVAASHSGRVAWVFDAKGVRNLWVADAPNFAARQVTHYGGDEGLPIASLRITGDGRTLVYVRRQRGQRKRTNCGSHKRRVAAKAAGLGGRRGCGRASLAGGDGLWRRRMRRC